MTETTETTEAPPTGDQLLIAQAIEASGMSARRFAERYLARDERTVRRWQSTATPVPIPDTARAALEWFLALTPRRRTALVEALNHGRDP